MTGMHSWTKKGAGGKNERYFRVQVGTGGSEKDRFTVQLSITKEGTKLIPCVIFKGAQFNGIREHRHTTVANEKHERLEDSNGN